MRVRIGKCGREATQATFDMMPGFKAAIEKEAQEDGSYWVDVEGDTNFFLFACRNQGYAKIEEVSP